jgi:hypothetical protein
MERLNWGPTTPITSLNAFLTKIEPTKRITVLMNGIVYHDRYTYAGPQFVFKAQDTSNCLYLIYDMQQEHYALAGTRPGGLMKRLHNVKWGFCHECLTTTLDKKCRCDQGPREPKPKLPPKECDKCMKIGCQAGCDRICQFCSAAFKKGYDRSEGQGHRCIVYSQPTDPRIFWKKGDPIVEKNNKKAPYMLWAYDLESAVKRVNENLQVDIFEQTADGGFSVKNGVVETVKMQKTQHDVNLVVARNVFDEDSERVFAGPTCLLDFITFMFSTNGGRNVCVAHNGSGYDSRLVFEVAVTMQKVEVIKPLARGSKFMQLKIGDTIFRDSMLHLPGSLANLAVGFFGKNANLRKGHFPHMFNTEENYSYEGPLPAKKYFDLAFMLRNEKQREEFHAWHDERSADPTPWY